MSYPLKSNSLFIKLFFSMAVSILLIVFVSIGTLLYETHQLVEDEKNAAKNTAVQLLEELKIPLLIGSRTELENSIQGFLLTRAANYIEISSNDKVLFDLLAMGKKHQESLIYRYSDEDYFFYIEVPLLLQTLIPRAYVFIFLLLLIIGLLLFFLHAYLSKYLREPVTQIDEALQFYRSDAFKKNPKKIAIKPTHTELDSLIQSLDLSYENQMNALKMEQYLREKVLAAVKDKSTFIALMAHDYKTPIINLIQLAQMISNQTDSRQVQQLVELLSQEINSMELMVHNTLDLAKIEAGHEVVFEAEKTEFFDEVTQVLSSFQAEAQKNGNRIFLTIDFPLRTLFKTDIKKYTQVLRNLVSNAVKYTENGIVQVRIEPSHKGEVMTYVTDSGIGISKEVAEHLFIPFKRMKTSFAQGTGVGLSLSQTILKQLHAELHFQNHVAGPGVTFSYNFPVQEIFVNQGGSESKALILTLEEVSYEHIRTHLLYSKNISHFSKNRQELAGVTDLVLCDFLYKAEDGLTKYHPDFPLGKQDIQNLVTQVSAQGGQIYYLSSKPDFDYQFAKLLGFSELQSVYDAFKPRRVLLNESASLVDYVSEQGLCDKHILLIDDSKLYRELLRERLTQLGLRVTLADSGLNALNFYQTGQRFDFVFMDHMMPGMNGPQAAKEIKAIDPSACIIGFTAARNEFYDIFPEEGAMDAVFVKNPRRLLEVFKTMSRLMLNKLSQR